MDAHNFFINDAANSFNLPSSSVQGSRSKRRSHTIPAGTLPLESKGLCACFFQTLTAEISRLETKKRNFDYKNSDIEVNRHSFS